MQRSFLVGLIGTGVTHSLTPALHMHEAAALGLDYEYRTIDLAALGLPPGAVGDLVRSARLVGFDALNITVPCKELVLEHLDDLDETAERLMAVNTIVFRHGQAVGYNTDVTGFSTALRSVLPDVSLDHVVMIGAGGAGRAIADALLTLGCSRLAVADTDAVRARQLVEELGRRFPATTVAACVPDDLKSVIPEAAGLVNCTPVGMAHHPGLPVDPGLLDSRLWVADIVYRPLRTPLLIAAEAAGCRILSGGHMAVNQAVDALRLITGLRPDRGRMLEHLRELTAGEQVSTRAG